MLSLAVADRIFLHFHGGVLQHHNLQKSCSTAREALPTKLNSSRRWAFQCIFLCVMSSSSTLGSCTLVRCEINPNTEAAGASLRSSALLCQKGAELEGRALHVCWLIFVPALTSGHEWRVMDGRHGFLQQVGGWLRSRSRAAAAAAAGEDFGQGSMETHGCFWHTQLGRDQIFTLQRPGTLDKTVVWTMAEIWNTYQGQICRMLK